MSKANNNKGSRNIELMKAVAYYRTSTSTNVGEDKDSRKRQAKACHDYARSAGLTIEAEFYDAAVKGKDPVSSRPGFGDLLEYCEQNDNRTIIFETASRFSRDQVVQELAYRDLRSAGYTLIAADAPQYFTDDTDNPSIKMIRQILGAVAEYQKDELVLKLRGARNRKRTVNKARGIVTLAGDGKVEGQKGYHETDPDLVREAKRLARKSPKTGKARSLRQIAVELFTLGYTTTNGKAFSASQVQRLL